MTIWSLSWSGHGTDAAVWLLHCGQTRPPACPFTRNHVRAHASSASCKVILHSWKIEVRHPGDLQERYCSAWCIMTGSVQVAASFWMVQTHAARLRGISLLYRISVSPSWSKCWSTSVLWDILNLSLGFMPKSACQASANNAQDAPGLAFSSLLALPGACHVPRDEANHSVPIVLCQLV